MSDLQDFISDMHGIRLHRRRTLTAFNHVSEGPLMEMLFNVTRPALRVTIAEHANHLAHPTHHPATAPAPTIIRKGMVNYRRELRGIADDSDKHG